MGLLGNIINEKELVNAAAETLVPAIAAQLKPLLDGLVENLVANLGELTVTVTVTRRKPEA